MFEGGTLRPREGEFVRDVLLTTATKGCLKSRLLSPASKDRSRTGRLSHSRRPEIRLLDNLSRVGAVMLDVVQGCRGEVGGRSPALSLFLLSCISSHLSCYIVFISFSS